MEDINWLERDQLRKSELGRESCYTYIKKSMVGSKGLVVFKKKVSDFPNRKLGEIGVISLKY